MVQFIQIRFHQEQLQEECLRCTFMYTALLDVSSNFRFYICFKWRGKCLNGSRELHVWPKQASDEQKQFPNTSQCVHTLNKKRKQCFPKIDSLLAKGSVLSVTSNMPMLFTDLCLQTEATVCPHFS